jgi:hypothetical protein
MFEAENIRDWRTHDVVDPNGHKIGQLEAVYVDTSTDEPAFASVRIGMLGRHRLTFVPLDRATVTPDNLRVAYAKGQVKDAFSIDTDGELAATDWPVASQRESPWSSSCSSFSRPWPSASSARSLRGCSTC